MNCPIFLCILFSFSLFDGSCTRACVFGSFWISVWWSLTDGSTGSSLAISPIDGSMRFIQKVPEYLDLHVPKIQTIFGLVGMLKLVAGSYLIVIVIVLERIGGI